MAVTVLDPRIHFVKQTPTATFFQRRLRDPNILTFFHTVTGQWILAYYLNRKKRIVDEIEDLGPAFEEVTDSFVNMIVSNYGGVDLQRTKRHLISKNLSHIRKQNEEILDDQDRWDWMKKRTADKAPVPYMFQTPMSGGKIGTPVEVG